MDKKNQSPIFGPTSWPSYRLGFAHYLALVNAPADLVSAVADFDYEGDQLINALYTGWTELEEVVQHEYSGDVHEIVWADLCDMMGEVAYELANAYSNSMNYAPGRAPKKLNSSNLQKEIESIVRESQNVIEM